MTQSRTEQEQWESAAGQVTAKLKAFAEGLPADEQAVLADALRHIEPTGAGTNDTTGYTDRGASGALDAINAIDWNAVYKALGVSASNIPTKP